MKKIVIVLGQGCRATRWTHWEIAERGIRTAPLGRSMLDVKDVMLPSKPPLEKMKEYLWS